MVLTYVPIGETCHVSDMLFDSKDVKAVPGPVLQPQRLESTAAITYGTLFLGADTISDVFGGMTYLFRVEKRARRKRASPSASSITQAPSSAPSSPHDPTTVPRPPSAPTAVPNLPTPSHTQPLLFRMYCRVPWPQIPTVDVLVVRQPTNYSLRTEWMHLWCQVRKVKCLILFHHPSEILGSDARNIHSVSKALTAMGYQVHTMSAQAELCGAPTWSHYTISVAILRASLHPDMPFDLPFDLTCGDLPIRSCHNLLRNYKVPRRLYSSCTSKFTPDSHPVYSNYLGLFRGEPVFTPHGPFEGSNERAFIRIENKGFRHLIEDEWRAIKGIHPSEELSLRSCATCIESNIFSCLGVHLHPFLCLTSQSSPRPPSIPTFFCEKCGFWTNHSTKDHRDPNVALRRDSPTTDSSINWIPQDLSTGSEFYCRTVQNLYKAVATLPPSDQQQVFIDAMETLACHRQNYTGNYIHRLVVLWWEWPRRHWTALREGTSMNFFKVPTPGFIANQEMDDIQLSLAVDFVEELIRLHVLKRASDHGVEVTNNFPLFLVPKPGQPGQYRCIADGKRGGQNDCCIPDPCIMTSPEQILPALYTGGWSVVLDMSKYFHTFPNKANERQFFGLLFPGTNEPYFYDRFPMGTCNSPGGSGRLGASFVRIILAKSPLFQGTPVDNSKVAMILGRNFDPTKGEGRILIGKDGLPAALLWINVDDILLHAPTKDKVEAAMAVVLDEMVRLGLICQHVKTNPPAQEVKYCGFLYNTESIPTMLVSDDKICRGLALVRFLQRGVFRSLARLTLSKVIGFLTSLVPATPSNIGASFLHSLNNDLHSLQDTSLQGTRGYYFTEVDLSEDSHIELYWWEQVLCQRLLCRQAQKPDMASLGITWGDGSGTGTGGTFNWISVVTPNACQPLETWLGVWDFIVLHFSSNWKELRTLLLTLQRLKRNGTDVRNRVLWYLTDNQVTYDVCRKSSSSSRELFKLIRDIRLLELELGCKLEVIHVPGKLMITQGTDGLSRGELLHPLGSQAGILSLEHLFTPADPSLPVLHWAFDIAGLSFRTQAAPWQFRTDLDDWSHAALLDTNTVWTVSPHLGHQCMVRAMQAWVESPWNSSHLFILPRVMQRNFGRVSKFIKIAGEGWDIPVSFSPVVPFVVYYLPPYCRLTHFLHKRESIDDRLDMPPPAAAPLWIRKQIEDLQGL